MVSNVSEPVPFRCIHPQAEKLVGDGKLAVRSKYMLLAEVRIAIRS